MEKQAVSSDAIKATCHCGGITVIAPGTPKQPLNECQCTICRRYGAVWAYYNTTEVETQQKEGISTRKYVWGDKTLEFHFCENCGCMMYWWPIEIPEGGAEMGVNSRMMDPDMLRYLNRVISFDDLLTPLK